MTNLIPPAAKKQIILEYWVRVVSSWVILWSFALLVGAVVLWPTYMMISDSSDSNASSVADATERTAQYDAITDTLVQATQQAQTMVVTKQQSILSAVVSDIQQQAGFGASVSGISVSRTEDGELSDISLSGIADDRQSLASFRDRVESLPYVDAVDLPIENLAANQDISFTVVAKVNNSDS